MIEGKTLNILSQIFDNMSSHLRLALVKRTVNYFYSLLTGKIKVM